MNDSNDRPLLKIITSHGERYLDVGGAFDVAHRMIGKGNLENAGRVLAWLDEAIPHDRRVEILRARCAAREGRFGDCSRILSEAFATNEAARDVVGPLHTVLVYRSAGLLPSARQELKELCSRHPELPSLWLLAGDIWHTAGRPDLAQSAWKIAQRHDYEPRLIATAVRSRLAEIAPADKVNPTTKPKHSTAG